MYIMHDTRNVPVVAAVGQSATSISRDLGSSGVARAKVLGLGPGVCEELYRRAPGAKLLCNKPWCQQRYMQRYMPSCAGPHSGLELPKPGHYFHALTVPPSLDWKIVLTWT